MTMMTRDARMMTMMMNVVMLMMLDCVVMPTSSLGAGHGHAQHGE
jgi:hypothetical protein